MSIEKFSEIVEQVQPSNVNSQSMPDGGHVYKFTFEHPSDAQNAWYLFSRYWPTHLMLFPGTYGVIVAFRSDGGEV